MKEFFRRARESGFTLVELLIVIALIAILSVAVLATINPVEQANKARDARVQNDAAEVLNAYERYYANSQTYPWMDVNSAVDLITVDLAHNSRSYLAGFGLCTDPDSATLAASPCDSSTEMGLLISTDELKASFLGKGYTDLSTDTGYTYMDQLWLIKQDSTTGNSIYVCYVPQAKSNRKQTSGLKDLGVSIGGVPTTFVDAADTDFSSGYANVTFADEEHALFKCVP